MIALANRKHLTSRDINLIDFLEENNLIITSELAAKYFYRSPTDNHKSALTVAQRRLNICCELGQLKRYRDHIDQCYVYYVGRRPSKIEHRLMITEFLINMHRKYEIIKFKVEFKDLESKYSIRPDIFIVFKFGTKHVSALVECENKKTYSNEEKYKTICNDYAQKKLLHILPYPLWLICVSKQEPETTLKPLWIKSDYSNFSVLEQQLIREYIVQKKAISKG